MVFVMVALGGITRLTESGLAITSWQPVTGVLPPLSDAQWQDAFAAYKAIPQYQAIHAGMSLADFQTIYFWEWLHRLWGRLIGIVFLLPFLYFLARRQIPRSLAPKLAGLFVLGALQGALGWWMVASGLEDRIEVSQYRLAAHLATAIVIYLAILWVALDLIRPRERIGLSCMKHGASAALLLGFNTFPLMDGHWIPPAWDNLSPWWRNPFENPEAAQFDHRLLAALTWAASLALFLASFKFKSRLPRPAMGSVHALFGFATLQAGLGIAALLLTVPLGLALAHQLGATLVLTATLVARHVLGGTRKIPPAGL